MKEGPFVNWIFDVARLHGWTIKHVPAPMRAAQGGGFVPEPRARGLLDLQLLHADPARLILAECKGDGGKLTDAQTEVLNLARGVVNDLVVHWHAVHTLLESHGVRSELTDLARIPIGVYVWAPGQEAIIETILKSKVLVRQ